MPAIKPEMCQLIVAKESSSLEEVSSLSSRPRESSIPQFATSPRLKNAECKAGAQGQRPFVWPSSLWRFLTVRAATAKTEPGVPA
jgi:hypothetical protein